MKTKFIAKDGTEYIVRDLKRSDAKSVFDYFAQLRKEKHPGLPRRKKNTLKDIVEWVNDGVNGAKKRRDINLVAEKDGKVIGTCEISYLYKDLNSRHIGNYNTSISSSERGKGLGTFMFKEQLKLIKKRIPNFKIVELTATSINKKAIKLYRRWGFRKAAEVPKRVKIGNVYYGDVVMHYNL
jgi:RimJ/RimL family protein N-acetyltransferase